MERLGNGRGSNSAQLRRYNERLVLQRLRRAGEASKADLARSADLTNTAIGAIIEKLVELGLIEAVGKRHAGGRGQPATMLRAKADGAYGIGVRLDRRSMETILIDFGGRVLARRDYDMVLPAPEEALAIVLRDIDELLATLDAQERPRFAGMVSRIPIISGRGSGALACRHRPSSAGTVSISRPGWRRKPAFPSSARMTAAPLPLPSFSMGSGARRTISSISSSGRPSAAAS